MRGGKLPIIGSHRLANRAMTAHGKNILFQHASAAELAGGAVLFTGNSGAGKTTVMRLIAQTGRRVFGDELAVCTREADGSWLLAAMGSTRDGELERATNHVPRPVALIVHLRRHLDIGFAIHPCPPMESVVLGYQSIMATGQHDPAVRASRFRTFSDFARSVPSVILDFSLNADFLPALEKRVAGGQDHGN